MASKNNPGTYDCYDKALPDEPMFVLLGRDPEAPALAEAWADRCAYDIAAGKRPESDRPMVAEAMECARAMKRWRFENEGKWRSPPMPDNQQESAHAVSLD